MEVRAVAATAVAAVIRIAAVRVQAQARLPGHRKFLLDSKSRLPFYRLLPQSLSFESCPDDPARRSPVLPARADRPTGAVVPSRALDLRVAAVRWDAHAVDHARDAADHEPAAADSPAPTMSSWKNPNRGDPEEAEVDLADRDPRVDPSPEPNGNRRPRFWCKLIAKTIFHDKKKLPNVCETVVF